MNRNLYYIGIAFFGMINGLPFFSPLYLPLFAYSAQTMTGPLFGNVSLIAYFASLMVSTATVILAGIPAAIYERYVGAKEDSTDASLWIWLVGTSILAIPAAGNFLRFGL
jgi:Na+/proline symporter